MTITASAAEISVARSQASLSSKTKLPSGAYTSRSRCLGRSAARQRLHSGDVAGRKARPAGRVPAWMDPLAPIRNTTGKTDVSSRNLLSGPSMPSTGPSRLDIHQHLTCAFGACLNRPRGPCSPCFDDSVPQRFQMSRDIHGDQSLHLRRSILHKYSSGTDYPYPDFQTGRPPRLQLFARIC